MSSRSHTRFRPVWLAWASFAACLNPQPDDNPTYAGNVPVQLGPSGAPAAQSPEPSQPMFGDALDTPADNPGTTASGGTPSGPTSNGGAAGADAGVPEAADAGPANSLVESDAGTD